jgi:predicted phosphodiesterase
MSQNSEHVKSVIAAINKLAKQQGISPHEVKKNDLLELVTDWTLKRAGSITAIKAAYFPIDEKDLKGIVQTKKQSSYINKLENLVGQNEITLSKLENVLKAIPKISVKQFTSKKSNNHKRELNLVLSDLHIGSDIHKEETGNLDFGTTEESRRLGKIIKDVCEYKLQHRSETKLNVLLLGDIIQNQLHDLRDGAPNAEQCGRAIYLLSQAIGQLSNKFPQVEIHCNSGNHGRNTGRHHGRAVNQKWDSLETIIYYALREVCKNLKNVKVNIPKTPYLTYEVFGKKIFATHGDSVLSVGYPGKAINTGRLETQVNKFNASLSDKEEYSVLVVGHVHTASITHLSNGAVLITNGALVPVDEYAVSIGLMETTSGQYMFESTPGFPVGDCRYIKVGLDDDKNKELNNVIKAWTN